MSRTIVTLCGSTKFKDDFYSLARKLQLQGYIVLMPTVWGHLEYPAEEWTDANPIKQELIELHRDMIRMSHCIIVIDINGHIGDSTESEIEFAQQLRLPIYYTSHGVGWVF